MPKIVWLGNREWGSVVDGGQEWDKDMANSVIPPEAVRLSRPDDPFKGLMSYIVAPALLCFAAVLVKRAASEGPFLSPAFLPASFLLGLAVALPLHEYLHALCYPRDATVYVGVCLRQLRAFVASASSLKRGRFVLMSLAPASLGILSVIAFLACPASMKGLATVCLVPMFGGLISPAPDYRDVLLVLRSVPRGGRSSSRRKGAMSGIAGCGIDAGPAWSQPSAYPL